jgi:hypothetical protein
VGVAARAVGAPVRVDGGDDGDLRPRRRPSRDEPLCDRDAGGLGSMDAADDEDAVRCGRVAQDDGAERASLDAVTDRERGQEKGKESHLHGVRSQVATRSVDLCP